ncbi:MAG: hypothetical protein AB4426_33925 [Xenococcaceae cyanobacterium]
MKKTSALWALTAIGLAIAFSQAAKAGILADWRDYFTIVQQSYPGTEAIFQQATDIAGAFETVFNEAIGPLGYGDPNRLRNQTIEEAMSSIDGDIAQYDPIYQGDEAASELDRQQTRAQINTILGQEGQQVTKDKLDWVSETVDRIQEQAIAADNALSTQDAVKALTEITADQAGLTASLQSELIQARQDTQFTNLNLARISENLDSEANIRRRERLGEAVRTLRFGTRARLF